MNREEALRKAVEVAPEFSEPEVVLAYADWLLGGERVSIELLPEGWDDPIEIPTEAMYSVGVIGVSRFGTVWVMVEDGVWEVYGFTSGHKSVFTFDTTVASEHGVVIVGKVRPASYIKIADLVGDSVSAKHSDLYPVGLIGMDRIRDLWVHLGENSWACYWSRNGEVVDYGPYSTKDVEEWDAIIVGGTRGQA